jgi:hypothetical protein
MMLLSGVMKLAHAAPVVASWGSQFGYPESLLTPIGLLEVTCAILYIIPRTAVLGAILVSCYLGAACATHVRVLDPAGFAPVVLGVFVWAGLYVRDARIRNLLPLVRPHTEWHAGIG